MRAIVEAGRGHPFRSRWGGGGRRWRAWIRRWRIGRGMRRERWGDFEEAWRDLREAWRRLRRIWNIRRDFLRQVATERAKTRPVRGFERAGSGAERRSFPVHPG